MDHIEFIGPPGAGKSTIHSEILSSDSLFGGLDSVAMSRLLAEERWYYSKIHSIIPTILNNWVENRFLEHRYKHFAFKHGISKDPNLIENMSMINNCVDREAWRPISIYKKAIEEFQIASTTIKEHETFCWDEGFAMAAVATDWHSEYNQFSIQEYYESLPKPNVLIYVDAPTEKCLLRQKERGRDALSHQWITNKKTAHMNHRAACERVTKVLENDSKVIQIENTNNLSDIVDEVGLKLNRIFDN